MLTILIIILLVLLLTGGYGFSRRGRRRTYAAPHSTAGRRASADLTGARATGMTPRRAGPSAGPRTSRTTRYGP